mmetsp:Transcript_57617/g.158242  ORF Transcript_57617/g.158242 Transcript_57617/m.158242 type:complete len:184 (-) Transcript_57617:362-913(-)
MLEDSNSSQDECLIEGKNAPSFVQVDMVAGTTPSFVPLADDGLNYEQIVPHPTCYMHVDHSYCTQPQAFLPGAELLQRAAGPHGIIHAGVVPGPMRKGGSERTVRKRQQRREAQKRRVAKFGGLFSQLGTMLRVAPVAMTEVDTDEKCLEEKREAVLSRALVYIKALTNAAQGRGPPPQLPCP